MLYVRGDSFLSRRSFRLRENCLVLFVFSVASCFPMCLPMYLFSHAVFQRFIRCVFLSTCRLSCRPIRTRKVHARPPCGFLLITYFSPCMVPALAVVLATSFVFVACANSRRFNMPIAAGNPAPAQLRHMECLLDRCVATLPPSRLFYLMRTCPTLPHLPLLPPPTPAPLWPYNYGHA